MYIVERTHDVNYREYFIQSAILTLIGGLSSFCVSVLIAMTHTIHVPFSVHCLKTFFVIIACFAVLFTIGWRHRQVFPVSYQSNWFKTQGQSIVKLSIPGVIVGFFLLPILSDIAFGILFAGIALFFMPFRRTVFLDETKLHSWTDTQIDVALLTLQSASNPNLYAQIQHEKRRRERL